MFFISLVKFIRSWRLYQDSLQQLSHLGDRELADIGLSRSEIPAAAWKASQAS